MVTSVGTSAWFTIDGKQYPHRPPGDQLTPPALSGSTFALLSATRHVDSTQHVNAARQRVRRWQLIHFAVFGSPDLDVVGSLAAQHHSHTANLDGSMLISIDAAHSHPGWYPSISQLTPRQGTLPPVTIRAFGHTARAVRWNAARRGKRPGQPPSSGSVWDAPPRNQPDPAEVSSINRRSGT